MFETVPIRARWYLAATATGILVALLALPLLLAAHDDRHTARGLTEEQLSLEHAVAEMRVLSLALRLDAARALLDPADDTIIRANASRRALISGEIRRARVHAGGTDTVDVIDDFENTLLRLNTATDHLFASRSKSQSDAGRAAMVSVEAQGVRLDDLAEELATIAATATQARAEGLAGKSRPHGILLLMVAALALAVHAGAMAWLESGQALRASLISTLAVLHVPGITLKPDPEADLDNHTPPAAINRGDSEDPTTADPDDGELIGGAEAGQVNSTVVRLRGPSKEATPVAGAAA